MSDSPDHIEADIIIVGAGFAGLYALHKLRSLGFSALVVEAGSGIGGTWFWNRYPGARCDVNSLEYSYQFSEALQQQWSWSEKYATQPEILEYLNHVADRFTLRPYIKLNTQINKMHFDDKSATWKLYSAARESFQGKFCIMASGCLSVPNIPKLTDLEKFTGDIVHTGKWPEDGIDFHNKRVGIIGTGSSAIQATPVIAKDAKSLTVFQRSASFSVPAHNKKIDKNTEKNVKANYSHFRQENSKRYAALDNKPNPISALAVSDKERDEIYEARWREGGLPFLASFNDLNTSKKANRTAVEFVHKKIKGIVKDARIAEALCPQTLIGCKRLCVDSDYYDSFNRDNVELVDLNIEALEGITDRGIRTSVSEYPVDLLILATGFDAMTGALLKIDIEGRNGIKLRDKWQHGPDNYLGLTVHGFPNLFTVTGPGSPSVLANMIVAIEQHINWIANCLDYVRDKNLVSIEASLKAESNWVEKVNQIADKTLLARGCNSWYTGANIPGKPRLFMPYLGYPAYVETCDQIAAAEYPGFDFKPAPKP